MVGMAAAAYYVKPWFSGVAHELNCNSKPGLWGCSSQPCSVLWCVLHRLREFMSEHHEVIRTQAVLDLDRAMRRWTVPAMEEMGIPNTFGFRNRQVGGWESFCHCGKSMC